MSRLENLPDIANRRLGGLTAGPELLGRIQSAAGTRRATRKAFARADFARRLPAYLRPTLAVCAAAALVAVIALQPESAVSPVQPQPSSAVLDSRAAGALNTQPTAAPTHDVSASLRVKSGSNAATSLLAPESNGNFPLVLVSGAAYRLLVSPDSVPDALLGESLGAVSEFTREPGLSSGSGIVSNTVAVDETVYAVSGMPSALVAAPVNGVMRAFQRVSFAGTAVVGAETLADTLAPADQVVALELSSVGSIDDAALAQSLTQTLLDHAVYQSASSASPGDDTLTLRLANGLALQLACGDDTLVACGTWSCPEFFEAVAEAGE